MKGQTDVISENGSYLDETNFWWFAILSPYKMSKFTLNMLIFMQKSTDFYAKIYWFLHPPLMPQVNLPYSILTYALNSCYQETQQSRLWIALSLRSDFLAFFLFSEFRILGECNLTRAFLCSKTDLLKTSKVRKYSRSPMK